MESLPLILEHSKSYRTTLKDLKLEIFTSFFIICWKVKNYNFIEGKHVKNFSFWENPVHSVVFLSVKSVNKSSLKTSYFYWRHIKQRTLRFSFMWLSKWKTQHLTIISGFQRVFHWVPEWVFKWVLIEFLGKSLIDSPNEFLQWESLDERCFQMGKIINENVLNRSMRWNMIH